MEANIIFGKKSYYSVGGDESELYSSVTLEGYIHLVKYVYDNHYRITGTRCIISKDPLEAAKELLTMQDVFDYDGVYMVRHLQVPLPSELTNEKTHEFANKMIGIFENFPVIYCCDTCDDKGDHINLLISPIDIDGNKLDLSYEFMNEFKIKMNEIANEYFPNDEKLVVTIFED